MLSDQTEVMVEVVAAVEAKEAEVVGVEAETQTRTKTLQDLREPQDNQPPQDTRGPSILICQLESGQDVLCISDTGEEHTFVQNRLPALGRTSSHQDLKNETGTSSAPHIH